MENSYNARCPAVKRLLKEAQELHEATEEYYAHPVDDNLFEWHFTVRGPPETEFDGGVYHGRIIMPAEYPMKPPNIIFFTPNGRFETNKKICLSISGHHPETWQPSWSIRTALLAIIGFMPTPAGGTIGSLDYTAEERALLSKRSLDYMCPNCGRVGDLLKERTGANEELQREAKAVTAQMTVTGKDISSKDDEVNIPEEAAELSSPQTKSPEEVERNFERLTCVSSSEDHPTLPPQDEIRNPVPESLPYDNSITNEIPPASSPSVESNVINTPTPIIQPSSTPRPSSSNSSLSLIANNIVLSAAVILLVALVLRRLFLLEVESKDEIEEILL